MGAKNRAKKIFNVAKILAVLCMNNVPLHTHKRKIYISERGIRTIKLNCLCLLVGFFPVCTPEHTNTVQWNFHVGRETRFFNAFTTFSLFGGGLLLFNGKKALKRAHTLYVPSPASHLSSCRRIVVQHMYVACQLEKELHRYFDWIRVFVATEKINVCYFLKHFVAQRCMASDKMRCSVGLCMYE